MATIQQHISDIRGYIKQVQDDSHFTDSFIYRSLNKAKNKIREQNLSKANFVSNFEWRTFCIELERTKSHDCSCVKVGCDVLKSVYELPGVNTSGRKDLIRIHTLGDILIPYKNEEEIKDDITDDVKSGLPGYMIRNGKIIIWNNLDYKAVQVTVLPEDITEWIDIQLCDVASKPCFDITKDSYDLGGGDEYDVHMLTLQMLGVPFKLAEDINANNNPNI